MDLEQMRAELRAAGYDGPWDDASVQAAYARTVNGGNAGSNSGAGLGGFDWSGLWGGLIGSNGQYFEEQKRQFNEQMALELRRLGLDERRIDEMIRQFNLNFDEMVRQFDRSQNQSLAMGLLNGAIQLGQQPENWLDYATYTNQGRDIFQVLTGSEPIAAFGAPTGVSNPNSITNIMRQLGITNLSGGTPATATPAAGAPGTGQAPALSNEAALDWIWQNRPDLKGFFESNGWDVSTPQGQRLAVQNWIGQVDPQWKGKTPQQVAQALGYGMQQPQAPAAPGQGTYTGQPVGTPQPFTANNYSIQPTPGGQQLPDDALVNYGMPGLANQFHANPNSGNTLPRKSAADNTPDDVYASIMGGNANPQQAQPEEPMVSLPHQINPMVWDSMSPTAQRMIIGAAQRGRTPSGVWTAEDFVRQINNARPRGNAPRRVNMGYGNSGSLF